MKSEWLARGIGFSTPLKPAIQPKGSALQTQVEFRPVDERLWNTGAELGESIS
jgi:hypothetical protein